MDQTNDGGPEFPIESDGLKIDLRDYFAGQALAGQLANADSEINMTFVAKWAYQYADAMLAERQKERE